MAEKKKFQAKIKGHRVDEDGNLIITVVGLPFGGPIAGRDFDGEFFDKHTDPGQLKVIHSYFDHGMDDWYLPWGVKGFSNNLIGVAKRHDGLSDHDGILYDIIVDRAHNYRNLLEKLVEADVLGASTSPSAWDYDPDVIGRFEKWHVVEVSLTPTPANPDAVVVKSIIGKCIGDCQLEGDNMPAKKKSTVQDKPKKSEATVPGDASEEVVTPVKATPATPAKATESKGKDNPGSPSPAETTPSETDTAAKVKAAFATEDESTPAVEQATIDSLMKMMSDMSEQIKALSTEIAEVKSKSISNGDGITDLQDAFPVLAGALATQLSGNIDQAVAKSTPEKIAAAVKASGGTVQTNPKQKYQISPNAPGMPGFEGGQ